MRFEEGGFTMTARGIVFDLDETLYRERQFALSGYRAVARAIEERYGVCEKRVFALLALALRRGRRARAFQDLADDYGLPLSCIPIWVEVYRTHQPHLKLHPSARQALESLRGHWRLGVLTNGLPAVQAAKVRALGVDRLVDEVVYADEFGGGKPGPAAFLEVLHRLGIEAGQAVFAGNDPVRDIEGARRIGMRTVLVCRRRPEGQGQDGWGADAVVHSVAEIPSVAERLVSVESQHVH